MELIIDSEKLSSYVRLYLALAWHYMQEDSTRSLGITLIYAGHHMWIYDADEIEDRINHRKDCQTD